MVFMSHETYTPARGGSAAAEIHALRKVFGDHADKIVIIHRRDAENTEGAQRVAHLQYLCASSEFSASLR